MSAPKEDAKKDNGSVVATPTSRCASTSHGTARNRRAATATAKKEAVSERAVSRQVMKPAKSASAGYQTTMLDTEQLDSLLKDIPAPDAANGNAAEDHGDSAVKGVLRGKTVSASTGPVKVVATEHHRVVTDEIGYDAPREDTTTTSFEAHVRMRMSRPRVPEGKAVVSPRLEDQMHGRGAATSQVNQRSSSRHSASGRSSRAACPDCGGFSCDVADAQTGGITCGCDHGVCCCCCYACCSEGEVEPEACCSVSSGSCSSCSHEHACKTDASSPRDRLYSAGSVSSTSACSSCREPEIGTLLRTTTSFCETLARALSGEQHATKRH